MQLQIPSAYNSSQRPCLLRHQSESGQSIPFIIEYDNDQKILARNTKKLNALMSSMSESNDKLLVYGFCRSYQSQQSKIQVIYQAICCCCCYCCVDDIIPDIPDIPDGIVGLIFQFYCTAPAPTEIERLNKQNDMIVIAHTSK